MWVTDNIQTALATDMAHTSHSVIKIDQPIVFLTILLNLYMYVFYFGIDLLCFHCYQSSREWWLLEDDRENMSGTKKKPIFFLIESLPVRLLYLQEPLGQKEPVRSTDRSKDPLAQ